MSHVHLSIPAYLFNETILRELIATAESVKANLAPDGVDCPELVIAIPKMLQALRELGKEYCITPDGGIVAEIIPEKVN